MFGDRRIRDALEAGTIGVWRWEVGTDRIEWSPNLEAIHRMPPGSFDGTFASFADDIHPDDRDRVMNAIDTAVNDSGAYEVQYRLLPRDRSSERWIEARGKVIRRDDAAPVMTGICHDITVRKQAESELAERLKQQETVAELGGFALQSGDLQSVFDRACAALARTLKVEYAKVLEMTPEGDRLFLRSGVGWHDNLVGNAKVDAELGSQCGFTLLSKAPVVVVDLREETRFSGPPFLRDHGVISGMSTIISGSDNAPYGVLGVHTVRKRLFTQDDINFLQSIANILGSTIQRVKAAEQQDFLFQELRHRVANLFAQVNAIHRLSAKTSRSIGNLCENFENRITAAGQAHAVISRYGWSPTPLRTLLEALLRPYASATTLAGPNIVLPADVAFLLSLAINELATNAAKHGCFIDANGGLSLRWQVQTGEERSLAIEWEECCTHRVKPPQQTSLGSSFVDTIVLGQLHGDLTRDFAASGLRVRMEVALPVVDGPELRELEPTQAE